MILTVNIGSSSARIGFHSDDATEQIEHADGGAQCSDLALWLEAFETRHSNDVPAAVCHRARKYIGAYAAALGGVDYLVFGLMQQRTLATKALVVSYPVPIVLFRLKSV